MFIYYCAKDVVLKILIHGDDVVINFQLFYINVNLGCNSNIFK